MEQKSFTLINRGMNRDLSISKVGESAAYENRNIRIIAHDDDTMLTVTNERGTLFADIELSANEVLIGWNVLNSNMVLFSHDTTSDLDRIYLVEYLDSAFAKTMLFEGDLNFDTENPIESVVYYETDDVQKIYWVDGRNVLRFMNFMAGKRLVEASDSDEEWVYPWQDDEGNYDNTYFDSNRAAKFDVNVNITKDNSGNPRANGVAQYLLTYFNKHGQETNYVWISDLVYLSPEGRGGAADEQNNNRVMLEFTNLDTSYDHFRVYMVLRTMYNGETTAYLVSEGETSETAIVVDDGAHLTLQDANRLLYLGSQPVIAGTMAHKDQTLFLGDLRSIGRGDIYEQLSALTDAMYNHETGLANEGVIEFVLTDSTDIASGIANIPYVENEGLYPYKNQLSFTSGQIMSFKGGEKYRFALKFQLSDGKETDAFWIGDVENDKYPVIDDSSNTILRPIAKCTLSSSTIEDLKTLGIKTVQLMIAEATYADRSVKAQGFVTPTVFNTWERYNDRVYGYPSWILRPRHSEIEYSHFKPVHNSISDTAEIECNYWQYGVPAPTPYFRYKTEIIDEEPVKKYYTDYSAYGEDEFTHYMMICVCGISEHLFVLQYNLQVWIIGASALQEEDFATWKFGDGESVPSGAKSKLWYTGNLQSSISFDGDPWDKMASDIASQFNIYLNDNGLTDPALSLSTDTINNWFYNILRPIAGGDNFGVFNRFYGSWTELTLSDVNNKLLSNKILNEFNKGVDDVPCTGGNRWRQVDIEIGDSHKPSYYNKNFMFVDENLVTLNSPEVSYEMVNLDDVTLNFRVVGVAKITSVISDYDISASHSNYAGENVIDRNFSAVGYKGRLSGITAWPLWIDNGLLEKKVDDQGQPYDLPEVKYRTKSDYTGYSDNIVYYWFYLWGRVGSITGYNKDGENKSILNKKTFANLHFSYNTIYATSDSPTFYYPAYSGIRYRMCEKSSSQLKIIDVDNETRYYSGSPSFSLSCPGSLKYPIRFSESQPDGDTIGESESAFLYSSEPIQLSYMSDRHLVFSLGTEFSGGNIYRQNLLPYLFESERAMNYLYDIENPDTNITDPILPWVDGNKYNVFDYNKSNIPLVEFELIEQGNNKITIRSRSQYQTEAAWYTMITDTDESCVNKYYEAYYGTGSVYYGYVKVLVDDTELEPVYKEYLVDLSGLYEEDGYYCVDNANFIYVRYYEPPTEEEEEERMHVHYLYINDRSGRNPSGWVWFENGDMVICPFTHEIKDEAMVISYRVNQFKFEGITGLNDDEQYILIGEVYQDYSGNDTRYGGTTKAAVQGNRFITAGPQYAVESMASDENFDIYANQGDTYFQRWDCLKTLPHASDSTNNVIDITSVMLETHINLDGRYDVQRGLNKVASIDESTFGKINKVYSQQNNFKISRDLDSDFDTDAYRSSITWTLQKNDMADVDEWTHITLASNLKLDGDKGWVRAIRRFRNSIIAFQDRGISEILFNSRTQLSTQDGVPVELANSGKVDGKRYITNKYGCVNKWSIVEGKNALYFVDNINKAFCSFADGIDNLSRKLGFSVEFNRINSMEPWKPGGECTDNFISFYDRIHSDVYLFGRYPQVSAGDFNCLVYNEVLGTFTSFFDYNDVQLMANIEDKFVAFSRHKLWYMNEGLFGDFFGTQYPFSVTYRVTPNPYTDKIWTNIDYRADFYRLLRQTGDITQIDAEGRIYDDYYNLYQPDETFDSIRVYNEYQDTGNFISSNTAWEKGLRKKFRIWRYAIPRSKAVNTGSYHTKAGLDRIRNPWINIKLEKTQSGNEKQDLMQLHDVTVRYFE